MLYTDLIYFKSAVKVVSSIQHNIDPFNQLRQVVGMNQLIGNRDLDVRVKLSQFIFRRVYLVVPDVPGLMNNLSLKVR